MPRLLFSKTGTAIWISHLDLMRLFQRSFKRAGLKLTHTQGFNPRPSVSIALPLSVGVESFCELLDFQLEGESVPTQTIRDLLNDTLVSGVEILDVYETGQKIRDLAFLDCRITLEYDNGVPTDALAALSQLFNRDSLFVVKKTKSGPKEQDIIPMIQSVNMQKAGECAVWLDARICCQNPTLNPGQIIQAICEQLPEMAPDFARIKRMEVYNKEHTVFR